MSYSYQSGAKKKAQKEKQCLSNQAKHSSICNWINQATPVCQVLVKGGPELMLVPEADCSLNVPDHVLTSRLQCFVLLKCTQLRGENWFLQTRGRRPLVHAPLVVCATFSIAPRKISTLFQFLCFLVFFRRD